MSKYIKSAAILLTLLLTASGSAQTSGSCTSHQTYVDAVNRCVDISTDDVIALGTLRVETSKEGKATVILQDESRGDIELILTPALVEAVEESPADSFEVEGDLVHGEMTVKNLRPIE